MSGEGSKGKHLSSAGEHFCKCTMTAIDLFDNEKFGAADFWKGYKLYCFAHYVGCETSKRFFGISKMGRIMCSLQNVPLVPWGANFDVAIREVWPMMEEYIWLRHGKDCTNLKALMVEFDDVSKLSSCKNGSLLLQVIQDDKHGTEWMLREALKVEINTNILDEVRARLNRAEANLANLSTSSRLAKWGDRSHQAKRLKQ